MTCRNGSHYECEKCKEPCDDRRERIYTVHTMYDIHNTGIDTSVARSYRSFVEAVDGCVDLIMHELNTVGEFREALMMDENHAGALSGFVESAGESGDDHYPSILDQIAVRQYVRNWLECSGFVVWNGYDGYHFYITENDLVGERDEGATA
jgi:hypothetical protein